MYKKKNLEKLFYTSLVLVLISLSICFYGAYNYFLVEDVIVSSEIIIPEIELDENTDTLYIYKAK